MLDSWSLDAKVLSICNFLFSNLEKVGANSDYSHVGQKRSNNEISPGVAAGISIAGTLLLAFVVVLLFTKCKKKRSGSRLNLLRSVDRYEQMPPRMDEDV